MGNSNSGGNTSNNRGSSKGSSSKGSSSKGSRGNGSSKDASSIDNLGSSVGNNRGSNSGSNSVTDDGRVRLNRDMGLSADLSGDVLALLGVGGVNNGLVVGGALLLAGALLLVDGDALLLRNLLIEVGDGLGIADGLVGGGAGLSGHSLVSGGATRGSMGNSVAISITISSSVMAIPGLGISISHDGGDKAQNYQKLHFDFVCCVVGSH